VQHFTTYNYKLTIKESIEIKLESPNIATLLKTGAKGTWTMVYDEGFEVKIDGHVYFALFAYDPKTPQSLGSSKARDYTSHCDQTMIGWYHARDNTNWGCFQAQKSGLAPWSAAHFHWNKENPLDADAVVAPVNFLETETKIGDKIFPMLETHAQVFEADHAFIRAHNEDAASTWEATVPSILVGKTEEELDEMEGKPRFDKSGFLELEAEQTNSGLTGVLGGQTRGTGSHHFTKADEELLKKYKLPKTVDYRSYVQSRSQGRCGSCYAFAMTFALEARIAIKSKGKLTPKLSPQAMLSCSPTNQGCKGGFPYLLAKHISEVGTVPESCHPYTLKSQCAKTCKDQDVYMGDVNYGYIGGYYGASDEILMMKELHKNGPFVVALQMPRKLRYYKSGVFSDSPKPPQHQYADGWQHTNHAVTIVGYGVCAKTGLKYWDVLNTWGTRWGDYGHFKIARGTNQAAIETMPVQVKIIGKRSPTQSKRESHQQQLAPLFFEEATRTSVLQRATSTSFNAQSLLNKVKASVKVDATNKHKAGPGFWTDGDFADELEDEYNEDDDDA